MVAGEKDNGVFRFSRGIERGQNPADLMVNIRAISPIPPYVVEELLIGPLSVLVAPAIAALAGQVSPPACPDGSPEGPCL